MNGNMGKAFLMTTDGLYIGSLFRDGRAAPDALPETPTRGMSISRTTPGGEWFGGDFAWNQEPVASWSDDGKRSAEAT
ncbi:MAG: hypothetical protein COZ06_10535 [Armatimonadetes bacterium CG_4_10_14_3_um_filter_66_18]|nr:hypothetical protein [Armatimonadota bacterium]PIU93074.1 MAG: hypothetical protein COS65_14610 [Armatimonadetes bacterium CG06_land_8_20_14_3_00_66_21]PIX37565.1 MAG: hypothetical protein COZ57_33715 [Armatimonadetes bacterium CG_4_8_14_3_um_filter_66_20]PIY50205.1 MAG: hypothetical protein COZ06_10535 [Armatimonadetes bacterium CG_4_10_14_3_um_filter_66_18]PJB74471.1 MAG: hypothetical protein CO096_03535 [Armatimonadetes bacterium CG_4_9_14_3_um_filter_66_14]